MPVNVATLIIILGLPRFYAVFSLCCSDVSGNRCLHEEMCAASSHTRYSISRNCFIINGRYQSYNITLAKDWCYVKSVQLGVVNLFYGTDICEYVYGCCLYM